MPEPEEATGTPDPATGNPEEDETPPEYIFPLFFTTKTQEIFECKADEDVTEDNPFKLISKEAILKDFKDRAAISDFHPVKSIVQVGQAEIQSLKLN